MHLTFPFSNRIVLASLLPACLLVTACGGGSTDTADEQAPLESTAVTAEAASAATTDDPRVSALATTAATGYSTLAFEGSAITVDGTQTVRYGADTRWVEKSITNGGQCTNEYFGNDPAFGVQKSCQVATSAAVSPPTSGTWTPIVKEGAAFNVAGTQTVRYGADTRWVQKSVTNSGQCTNAYFGNDPAYGIQKSCELLTTSAPAAAPAPTPVSPTCTQTLNPGTSVSSAVSAAAPGATICLNSGSYGSQSFNGIVKSTPVTVRSTTAQGATLSPSIGGTTSGLRLDSLTLGSSGIQGAAKNITISNSRFVDQLVIRMDAVANANILIDANTFDAISVCASCYEGRLQVNGGTYPIGVKVSRNHFGAGGESDGIQIGAAGVVVGPGNVFDGIRQGSYGRHVDAIQGYGQSRTTITGNYFRNGDAFLMFPDGGTAELINHNVFDGGSGNNGIQLGSHNGDVFEHNTVRNVAINMDKKTESPTPSQNIVGKNNLLIGTTFKTVDSAGNPACTNCSFDHNLYTTSSAVRGTNSTVATPAFVGGSLPTSWAGWQLAPASPGTGAATDGRDLGANSFGN